jgi:hypothetical protein
MASRTYELELDERQIEPELELSVCLELHIYGQLDETYYLRLGTRMCSENGARIRGSKSKYFGPEVSPNPWWIFKPSKG